MKSEKTEEAIRVEKIKELNQLTSKVIKAQIDKIIEEKGEKPVPFEVFMKFVEVVRKQEEATGEKLLLMAEIFYGQIVTLWNAFKLLAISICIAISMPVILPIIVNFIKSIGSR